MVKKGNLVAVEPNAVLRAILGWYFKHGGEGTGPHDPGWASTPIGQIGSLTAIHEMAGQIADRKIAKQLQVAAAQGIASVAGKLAG